MPAHYTIPKSEQKKTLHVSKETHFAMRVWANKHDLTMVEATYVLLLTGMRYFTDLEKKDDGINLKETIRDVVREELFRYYEEQGLRPSNQHLREAE